MALSRVNSGLCPELEAFLYAPVQEDSDGAELSVLSALSRLDLDPWAEAAALAALPRGNAARRLAHLIAQLPVATSARRDSQALAARLVALLPQRGGARYHQLAEALFPAKTRALRISFLTGCLLGMQWLVTSCQPPMYRMGDSPPADSTSHAPLAGSRDR